MRKDLSHIEKYRSKINIKGFSRYLIPIDGKMYCVITSVDKVRNEDVTHVSVSNEICLPTWEVMCKIKDLFFEDEEEAYQIHPKKSEYVNLHKNCLHLWNRVSNNK